MPDRNWTKSNRPAHDADQPKHQPQQDQDYDRQKEEERRRQCERQYDDM